MPDTSGTTVPYPRGGFNMPNQDAHGGWPASAVDLARWTLAFDRPGTVLSSASIGKLVAKPEIGVNVQPARGAAHSATTGATTT